MITPLEARINNAEILRVTMKGDMTVEVINSKALQRRTKGAIDEILAQGVDPHEQSWLAYISRFFSPYVPVLVFSYFDNEYDTQIRYNNNPYAFEFQIKNIPFLSLLTIFDSERTKKDPDMHWPTILSTAVFAAIARWLLHHKSMEQALEELVYIRAHQIFKETHEHRFTIAKTELDAWMQKLKQSNTWAAWRKRKTVL